MAARSYASATVGLLTVFALGLAWIFNRVFVVPANLRHLPRVPIIPLFFSYMTGETEERRTLRLFLPTARKHNSGLVLVWVFGIWIVHCVDYKTGKAAMENRLFSKEAPDDRMLFWRFTGKANVLVIDGEQWKKQSKPVRSALVRSSPIPQFVALSQKLFSKLGEGGRVCWSDFSHRFSLDAIGTTALGYDFEALDRPDSPFVTQYHRVMDAVANPLYIFLPILETWFPRKKVMKEVDELVESFRGILATKQQFPGDDIISYLLEDPSITDTERRDNMVTLFMAGHDTTAGSLSTLVYCFAKYPECQRKAREEVLRLLGNETPTAENLSKLPYLQACVREGMRFNNPSTTNIPRVSQVPVDVCGYTIPPGTRVMLNMYGVHHNPALWPNAEEFDPERFLRGEVSDENGWLPFGLGPRQCPARVFSLNEQRTLIAMLLREYEWRLPEDSLHKDYIHTAFSAFALNLPYDLDIIFTKLKKA